MKASTGLTLLEVMVTVTIITIVTFLTLSAFPIVREAEALKHASQQIASSLRAAQVQALDEQRAAPCLAEVGENPLDAKRCSDIGLQLEGRNILIFADTNDNNEFDTQDFRLQTFELARPVQVTVPVSLLIEATPPNITLYVDGEALNANDQISIELRAIALRSRQRTMVLSISPYGVIEQ